MLIGGRHHGIRDVSPARAAAATVGMQQMLMASGAGWRAGDPGRGDPGRHETARSRGEEVHVRPAGGTGKAHIARETVGHLRSDFEAAWADRGAEQGAQPSRLAEVRDRLLEDPRGEPSPPRVHESDPGIGGGEEDRQTVGDAHAENEAGYPAHNSVAAGERADTFGAAHRGAMDLIESHRRPVAQRTGCGRGQRASDDAELGDAGWKGSEPENEGAAFQTPLPTHGRGA